MMLITPSQRAQHEADTDARRRLGLAPRGGSQQQAAVAAPEPGFPLTDAALFERIRDRANIRPAVSWEKIAEELGMTVPGLLDWFLAYRSPKQVKGEKRAAVLLAFNPAGGQHSLSRDAQRFANWRRGQHGAATARGK